MKKIICSPLIFTLMLLIIITYISACTPKATVTVETERPIEINLNVNINHNIKVQMDKELDSLFQKNQDIF